MKWRNAETDKPADASVVVGVVPGHLQGTYMRVLVQCYEGRWYHVGSDQQCRDVVAWAPTPPISHVEEDLLI